MSSAMHQHNRRPTYALGFHGEYKRNAGAGHNVGHLSSDIFINYDNINSRIIRPLQKQGGDVLVYFDTVSFSPCPDHDGRLVELLKPINYTFTDRLRPGVADSYIAVMNMILQDRRDIGHVILLRFDVMYHMPITDMPIDWEITNAAFRDEPKKWNACNMISDLFFVVPMKHVQGLIEAFEESAYGDSPVMSPCSRNHNTGHLCYVPFVKACGEDSMNFIQNDYNGTSDLEYDEAWPVVDGVKVFLGVNRNIGPDFDKC